MSAPRLPERYRYIVIEGPIAVGKTSLAVHVAHRLAASYPDGGLYLDLQGFTPGQEHASRETREKLRQQLRRGDLDTLPEPEAT